MIPVGFQLNICNQYNIYNYYNQFVNCNLKNEHHHLRTTGYKKRSAALIR